MQFHTIQSESHDFIFNQARPRRCGDKKRESPLEQSNPTPSSRARPIASSDRPPTRSVPYIFESMQFRGTVPSLDKLIEDDPWIPSSGTVVRTREIPLDNAVVRFP